MELKARVKIAESSSVVSIPISSDDKPEVSSDFEEKWQELVDIAARIINVPSGLIMRLLEKEIEVFRSSHTEKNPYKEHEKAELGYGLYCETVVGKREELLVPDALEDENWKNNPDVELNMVSYYGVPICWPDGEIFGTFCVLDNKKNRYTNDQKALVRKFAELVERDLKTIQNQKELLNSVAYKEVEIREIRHRIKNQLIMLSAYIDLQMNSGETRVDDFAAAMQHRIQALSSLHASLSDVEKDYTISLIEQLKYLTEKILAGAHRNIGIDIDGPPLYFEESVLVPVSMIVTELIMNSLKYAFDGVENPRITIRCEELEDTVTIIYQDNGRGHNISDAGNEGLGTMIIQAIADQLSASVRQRFENGFRFELALPRNAHGPSAHITKKP